MDIDDLDIYEDLEEFDTSEKLKLKIEECNLLSEKYRSALKQIEELQLNNKGLRKKIENIEKSFSSLLTTARTEITRKTTQIAELRKERDDICFRRDVRGRPAPKVQVQESQHAAERRKEPHNLRHGHEKEPNPNDRNSSRTRHREEKSMYSHKSSERDHSRSWNPFRESEDKSSTKHQITSNRNSLKDESRKRSHLTSKYNENRHRDHLETRKEERSNDRRKEEKPNNHRKQKNSNDHRKEEKLNEHRKGEKTSVLNDPRIIRSKSLDKGTNSSAEMSISERDDVCKTREKQNPNKIKTQTCSQNKTSSIYKSLPELDLNQAILENSKKDKIPNDSGEAIAEAKHPKIAHITLSAYQNRMTKRRSESEDNACTSEGSGANNLENLETNYVTSKQVEEVINMNKIQLTDHKSKTMPSTEKYRNKVENTLVQNKKHIKHDSTYVDKKEVASKRTFEDVLFDELVFENQNTDKGENCESEDEFLYEGLDMEESDKAAENSKNDESDSLQHKMQTQVLANDHEVKTSNSNTENNIIEMVISDTSKSKTVSSFDLPKLDPKLVKEVEISTEERNILQKIDYQLEKIAGKESSKDFLSIIIPSEQDTLKTSTNDTHSDILCHQNDNPTHDKASELIISKADKETNSINKAEGNLSSYSNIFDTSFELENNKPAAYISPYFGDQKTPTKHTNNSQLPTEHNNSIENQMAVMFKESSDQLSVLPPNYETTSSLQANIIPERNVQNKAKEMFDLYLASPTNVVPSEIENSKDRSPPNPTITGMKKRKSSTPRKSPGLLNGRGLKLVGHRIEGFEPGIRGEKALEASKLKNALFKEILGNECSAEEAAFRINLQENSDEKDLHLNNEDVLEAQEENRSQAEEGINKARNTEEDKIENINGNRTSKKVVRFDVSAELVKEKSGDNNVILKALECLENISDDDDLFSDVSSDFDGKQSTNDPVLEEHQEQKEITEHMRSNEINVTNDKSDNSAEVVKMEESKDLDDEEINATDESEPEVPSKVENESFTDLPAEEGDKEVLNNPNRAVSDYNNRICPVPFGSDKICVVIPLSIQDSIKAKEPNLKKSPSTYSSEMKIAEEKPPSIKSNIKEDIQEDEINIENEDFTSEGAFSQENNHNSDLKDKRIKKYVEDFCKTIESVEEETVSDSIRSQASDQGVGSSMYNRQSIVTFSDLLKLPNRVKDTNNTDSSQIVKPHQSRTKLNFKNKRNRTDSGNRKSIYIKSKESVEGSAKSNRKNPLQSSDVKRTSRYSKKMRGVFVRSLYVNSTQEKDITILKHTSSAAQKVNVNELLFKSENVQSTPCLLKEDHSSEHVVDTPVKPESEIKHSPPENPLIKPKMPLIRTVSQKRRGTVLSPKKKRRKIEIVYSKEDESFSEQKEGGTSAGDEVAKTDRANEPSEISNCPALTKENIRKMLASLNQANLKGSEDGKGSKENNKAMSTETAESNADKNDKDGNRSKERLSVEMEALAINNESPASSEKDNLFEAPIPIAEKIEEQTHENDDKMIKEKFIELFGESPMPIPIPTPKHRNSENDEVECNFEQLDATNNNNQQEFKLLKHKEFKQQTEEPVHNIKSKEFEEQTAERSPDKNETDKTINFIVHETEKCKTSENCDIRKIIEPLPKAQIYTESYLTKSVVEMEKQESIQLPIEEEKESLCGAKRKMSFLSELSFDENKTEPKVGHSLNNSVSDPKNISTISTSSADYRIEAVSSDVVNVFITRKRRKRKA